LLFDTLHNTDKQASLPIYSGDESLSGDKRELAVLDLWC